MSSELVCSLFLSLSGPMCVALASIHTAVQAGRLCQEGTSVLFVSPSLLKTPIPQSPVKMDNK